MPLLASLDLGTNTFRLLIAKVTDSTTLVPIVTKRVIVRLGKGIDRNGSIQPHAFEKGIKAIIKFSQTINQYKVEKVFAVTTSVARVAKNGEEFIEKVLEQTGIPVRIVSGFEEATLTLKGIFSAVECNAHKSL
ncbi:MAG: exopolyphosphatase, partial [Thermodesulfobacteriota bacterium]